MIKRKTFSRIPEVLKLPNLVEVQTKSFRDFLQIDSLPLSRKKQGLQEVFLRFFPVESSDGKLRLEFISYSIGMPKYSIKKCCSQGFTYSGSLKIKVRLVSKEPSIPTQEEEIYLGEVPLMTPSGTFIINGVERVIVNQLHRSPGICFEQTSQGEGKQVFYARIIPCYGVWIEIELQPTNILYAYFNRRHKLLATSLLKILGCASNDEIVQLFCPTEAIKIGGRFSSRRLLNRVSAETVLNKEGDVIISPGQKIDQSLLTELIHQSSLGALDSVRVFTAKDTQGFESEEVKSIINTLSKDPYPSFEATLMDLYQRIRPDDRQDFESAKLWRDQLLYDPRRYDLGEAGRFVINRKLNLSIPLSKRTLTKEDVVEAIKYLFKLKQGKAEVDDIDDLGNRRVRTVGELLQEQFRFSLARLRRAIEEKMAFLPRGHKKSASRSSKEEVKPHSLINHKIISESIKDFFARSQLSQFMDQTNPLAELTHKRRLSALGPGGLTRKRAGFEVRDIHPSHYGRICPIETPEGPNIGLIVSLSTYARVNRFGFLETPYRKVEKKRVTSTIEYLSADREAKYAIAQANARLNEQGRFLEPYISCRLGGNFSKLPPHKIDYMDVSPKQLVSIAAGLIPFLEHDDSNRALMGSNMQRQSVPLLFPEPPLVGTGLEKKIVEDSGAALIALQDGKVESVSADEIVISPVKKDSRGEFSSEVSNGVYKLRKFERSNASTCINQRPIVREGERIKKGQIISSGPSVEGGELSLGRNLLVAFMPWRGFNFEDAVLISEEVIKEDLYTSISIEQFEIECRETKLGPEEITRDIPNVGEEALKKLDENGIVHLGAEVGPGDILVGKVAPKSESELSPEERLLRAIFGEKASDVKDVSLVVPPGVKGVVIDIKIFEHLQKKSRKEKTKELIQIEKIQKQARAAKREIKRTMVEAIKRVLIGEQLQGDLLDRRGKIILKKGKVITGDLFPKLLNYLFALKISSSKEKEIMEIEEAYRQRTQQIDSQEREEINRLKRGDELPSGVLKKIIISVACKKKLSVGDKMAGRHGNKGVVAKILPEEDMPFLPDGTPVQIVLNPLGVPSRMNLGQILETHLGWAAKVLNTYYASPVFDGISEEQIREELKRAGLPEDGKVTLFDGITGKAFDEKVTVGYIYMMKLNHLAEDKIHARSVGPYSLITQQPLGGKAQFGGQRFGEMEVWALEAYGAAYTLQELLTVKSDDVLGRTQSYEAIVKGENVFHSETPESFNVLIKELQGLGLDVRLEKQATSHKLQATSFKPENKKPEA